MSRLDLAHKLINWAIACVDLMPKTRETSLAKTKLQEALMWLVQYEVMNNAQD